MSLNSRVLWIILKLQWIYSDMTSINLEILGRYSLEYWYSNNVWFKDFLWYVAAESSFKTHDSIE